MELRKILPRARFDAHGKREAIRCDEGEFGLSGETKDRANEQPAEAGESSESRDLLKEQQTKSESAA